MSEAANQTVLLVDAIVKEILEEGSADGTVSLNEGIAKRIDKLDKAVLDDNEIERKFLPDTAEPVTSIPEMNYAQAKKEYWRVKIMSILIAKIIGSPKTYSVDLFDEFQHFKQRMELIGDRLKVLDSKYWKPYLDGEAQAFARRAHLDPQGRIAANSVNDVDSRLRMAVEVFTTHSPAVFGPTLPPGFAPAPQSSSERRD
ncbi:hypothetical protein SBOR_2511 [Sclerotinia borealis F-4128]|uniref:Uncharacterized protein n=1 Tax=Sclerotinia borealis (strain F-4128) TaxID=1432307 RepID=W9CMK9_SCLBF|nr:hypothetical protein SBOR_2511 [Sclerotinia borealis F-4128]